MQQRRDGAASRDEMRSEDDGRIVAQDLVQKLHVDRRVRLVVIEPEADGPSVDAAVVIDEFFADRDGDLVLRPEKGAAAGLRRDDVDGERLRGIGRKRERERQSEDKGGLRGRGPSSIAGPFSSVASSAPHSWRRMSLQRWPRSLPGKAR
jgi:hypothetical protein